MKTLTPQDAQARLKDKAEFALIDVREQGVHYKGHPFFASSLPLSRLELMATDLLPRKTAPLALLDGGDGETLAERASAKLAAFGYRDVAIMQGGCAAWRAAGYELFSGVNVPSKAFGEFVEHEYETPRLPAEDVLKLQRAGAKMVILDSRPLEEFRRMAIPGGIDTPGAELALRVHDLAPDPDTLVVVNCAGRTRSIIGCQSLRNAGIPNRVVALKDGTMGWDLAGYECERGAAREAPFPSRAGLQRAQEAAARVAKRFQVRFADAGRVRDWLADKSRTLYLLDVRSRTEFDDGHIAGSRHAPGGQVVQATDEYVGVRGARIVLVDPARVRSVMTASWLNQMGWDDVHVLEPAGEDGFDGWPVERGPRTLRPLGFRPHATVPARELVSRLPLEDVTVIDLSTSLNFRERHIPGAWWAVRARLDEAKRRLPAATTIVLTSEDGTLAHLAAPEAVALWPGAEIRALDGGNASWFLAGLIGESGLERATTANDDVWYKPYDYGKDYEKHARDYLTWEVALVEQIKRDSTIRFRKY